VHYGESVRRLILGLLGALLGLIGLGVMSGGLVLLGLFGVDGRTAVQLGSLESDTGRAVVVTDFEISTSAPVPVDESWFDLRLNVSGAQSLFVGVADRDDSLEYLQGVPYTLVTGIDSEAGALDSTRIPGDRIPPDPASQDLWTDGQSGREASVQWPVTDARTTLVVMNSDVSRGIDADVEVDVTISWVGPLAVGLVVAGVVLIIFGIVVLVIGLRTEQEPQMTAPPPGTVG
jgi:hypothetical protein